MLLPPFSTCMVQTDCCLGQRSADSTRRASAPRRLSYQWTALHAGSTGTQRGTASRGGIECPLPRATHQQVLAVRHWGQPQRPGQSRKQRQECAGAGLQFLTAGGRGHAHHGVDIWKGSRAKGKAAWADKVQLFLAGHREEIVHHQGRGRRRHDVLRRSQGDRQFRKLWLVQLTGHLEY